MRIKYLNQDEIDALRERAAESRHYVEVLDVLEQCGFTYKKSGSSIFFQCPDCGSDNAVTSTGKPTIWHCFSCGKKGSNEGNGTGLSLLARLQNRRYGEVVAEQGYAYGFISADEYDFLERLTCGRSSGTKPKPVAKERKKMPQKHTRLNRPDILHFVYSNMLRMEEFQLTDDARAYLSNRGVRSFEDFFCYHKSFPVSKLTVILKNKMPTFQEGYYFGVPGFYFQGSEWKFTGRQADSVGLVVRNSVGQIVGLQTRNIKKEGQRYYWISSAPKNENDDCDYGSSPGAPCHFYYPDQIKSGKYIITEGIFKIRHLVDVYEGIGISLQGVTNSFSVRDEIIASWKGDKLLSRLPKDEKLEMSIDFFFDSDMLFVEQVYDSVVTCYHRIKNVKKDLPAYFHLWTLRSGKGFDDFILAHPTDWQDHIYKVEAEDFIRRVEETRAVVKEEMGIQDLPPAELNADKQLRHQYRTNVYQRFWTELMKSL